MDITISRKRAVTPGAYGVILNGKLVGEVYRIFTYRPEWNARVLASTGALAPVAFASAKARRHDSVQALVKAFRG
jgi:hypothetical protein